VPWRGKPPAAGILSAPFRDLYLLEIETQGGLIGMSYLMPLRGGLHTLDFNRPRRRVGECDDQQHRSRHHKAFLEPDAASVVLANDAEWLRVRWKAAGVPEGALHAGIDGCSAPNYAMPLARLALAFARLASADVDPVYGRAPRQLADAMTAAPEMVSGDGRSDLALTRAGLRDWVCKVGAEAVQAIGIRSRGWGIAIKVADGSRRGLLPATVSTLEQLGLLDGPARAALAPLRSPVLRNYRGLATGEGRAVVVLDKADRGLTPVAASAAE